MKKSPRSSLSNLSGELKRRGVYPVIAAYAVAAWVLLQIGEVTLAPLGFPDWAMTALIVATIVGFPVAVVLAWVFDLKPPRRSRVAHQGNGAGAGRPSVAVLPFADMSPDHDQAFFCDGIAEEILNALTTIPQLHVAARMSSFQFRGGAGDIRAIGRELGVGAVLEGSVRKAGDQLRVTVQLVKASDGYQLWSRSFDEELEDVFAIQNEIATGVARAMLETLAPVRPTANRDVSAYEYYLRGRYFFHRFNKLDIQNARRMFHHAIDLDPDFAQAWAGYADCHSFMVMYVDPQDSYREEATQASVKAVELDPSLAEAHASRGLAHLVREEFEDAEAEFEAALDLNPTLFEAYYYFGRTRFHQGDMRAAADLFKKAAEVNPADYQSRLLRVQILRGMGHYEEALAEARRGVAVVEKHLEWNPDDARALHLGAASLILTGEIERADRWLQRAIEIDPNDSVVLYNVACNYATLGRTQAALDYLEQAIEHGTVSASWMRNDEDLASLHGHPRYAQMLSSLEKKDASGGG
ncbi:MAG: tetratricopeptide repeat protein [Gemmatimonadota bacterium]